MLHGLLTRMKEPKRTKEHKQSRSERNKSKKKHKKHKRHRKKAFSTSSSDKDNVSTGGQGSALSQLERERTAVQACRYILAAHTGVRKSFRELLWELDNGQAVGISGISDELLRTQLQYTLDLLGLKCTKGQYWLPSGAPSTLSVVGFVFDEPPPSKIPVPSFAMLQKEQPAAAGTPQPIEQAAAAAGAPADIGVQSAAGPQLPADMQLASDQQLANHQMQPERQQQVLQETGMPRVTSKPVVGSGMGSLTQAGPSEHDGDAGHAGNETGNAGDHPVQLDALKRRMGPAAPPPELLAAAATYHAEVQAAGGYGPAANEDTDSIIGPPPPDLVDETDAAPANAREAEVLRVLQVLKDAAARSPVGPAAAAGPAAAGATAANPYAVLGVEPAADTASIRKRYWCLSLLVHPDKCSHPAAQEVFQAVSKAAQLLQDSTWRQQLDAAQDDAKLHKQALAAAADAERAVAWKRARGEAIPAGLAVTLAAAKAASAGPATRESWMTELPTQQRSAGSALAGLSQVSQSSFSRFGKCPPGDISSWTDTPEQRARRAAGLLTDTAMAALTAGSQTATAAMEAAPVSVELMAAMTKYSQQQRQQSLLEQHRKKQQQPQKKAGKGDEQDKRKRSSEGKQDGASRSKESKKRPAGDAGKDTDWEGKHPWRPFDRDKDLEVIMQQPECTADLLKAAGALSNRFSSGGR